jgi:hypothetical protein
MFAVVRDQDGRAKQHVQALLRQSGRDLETKLRVVSDGEDGMRSLVGKLFNANEQHVLDWYDIARRFEAIGKGLVYLPHVEDFRTPAVETLASFESREVGRPVPDLTAIDNYPRRCRANHARLERAA